eukprot:GHVP01001356.1.p1 GENE.GHVP01001356.1~~GHVP01001356.1.p1  ORF type:complete len:131 (-),score=14.87 GHVP01001356.1:71-463(-)
MNVPSTLSTSVTYLRIPQKLFNLSANSSTSSSTSILGQRGPQKRPSNSSCMSDYSVPKRSRDKEETSASESAVEGKTPDNFLQKLKGIGETEEDDYIGMMEVLEDGVKITVDKQTFKLSEFSALNPKNIT